MHRLEMVRRSTVRIVMQTRQIDRQSMATILQRLYSPPVKILYNTVVFVNEKIDIDMNKYYINGISIDIIYNTTF